MAKSFPNTGATVGLAADRTAMTSMVEGQEFFETDTNKMFVYSGSGWVETNTWGTTSGVTGVSTLIVPPMCSLTRTTNQSINNAIDTRVEFDTASINTDGMATTGASAKITIQTTGVYLVTMHVVWPNYTSTTERYAAIWLNNTGGTRIISVDVTPTTGEYHAAASRLISLSATQTLDLYVYQSSGSARSLSTISGLPAATMSALWVGRAA